MKIKKILLNLMCSTIVMITLLYLFTDWFIYMATYYKNFSHYIDIFMYPVIGLIWVLVYRSKEIYKFIIWSNRIVLPFLIIFSIYFYMNIGEESYMIVDKEVTDIAENNDKYYIQISNTLNYYFNKNDTVNYDTINYDNWKVYISVRQDILNDTIYGDYYLGNVERFEQLTYINNH